MDWRRCLALLAVVLLATSCASGTTDPEHTSLPSVPDTTTTQPPPTTTFAPTTTTAPATTTTAGPSDECASKPDAPPPVDGVETTTTTGDIDGDGHTDTVTGYLLGSEDPTQASGSILRLELASGWGAVLAIEELGLAVGGPISAEPRALVELGGDTTILSRVAGILPGHLFAFFRFEDCVLSVVDTSSGNVPDIWVGGGASNDEWFVCGSDTVTMVSFSYPDPVADPRVYESGDAHGYLYEDGVFVDEGSVEFAVDLPAPQDEVEAAYPRCAR
jgi:hypothetical protein